MSYSYEFVVSGQDSRARSEEPSRRLGSLASRFFFVHGEMDGHDARTDTCCHRMPDAAPRAAERVARVLAIVELPHRFRETSVYMYTSRRRLFSFAKVNTLMFVRACLETRPETPVTLSPYLYYIFRISDRHAFGNS